MSELQIPARYLNPASNYLGLVDDRLSDDEESALIELRSNNLSVQPYLKNQTQYYEGDVPFKSLGIAVPESLTTIGTVVEWPATVVDILAERINWRGWDDPRDRYGLGEVARDSMVYFEFSQANLESLIYGQGFIEVYPSAESSVGVNVQATSGTATTGIWNAEKRRLGAGWTSWTGPEGKFEKLFTETHTITLLDGEVIDRWAHGFGRPTLVRVPNRLRASRPGGRSEITRSVRYYTDTAMRSILGMEVNREFYTKPQHYAIGFYPEDFGIDSEAPAGVRAMQGFKAVSGSMLVAPPSEEAGDTARIGQFQSEGPSAYWETVKALSQLCASAAGMPAPYFGFVTENPTSADAIRQAESRLNRRAEDKVAMGSWASREVAWLAIAIRDGNPPDPTEFREIHTRWGDVATPTKAAAADAGMKLIGAGVLPPDSDVTYDFVGLSDQDQRRLREEKRRATADKIVDLLQREVPAEADQLAEVQGEGGLPASDVAQQVSPTQTPTPDETQGE